MSNTTMNSTRNHMTFTDGRTDMRLHNERIVNQTQKIDHLALRVFLKASYSPLRYKNILRCPEVVFASYGSGL